MVPLSWKSSPANLSSQSLMVLLPIFMIIRRLNWSTDLCGIRENPMSMWGCAVFAANHPGNSLSAISQHMGLSAFPIQNTVPAASFYAPDTPITAQIINSDVLYVSVNISFAILSGFSSLRPRKPDEIQLCPNLVTCNQSL